jgi:hypothetical protein
MHVVIASELVEQIDRVAGECGRSRFLEEAARASALLPQMVESCHKTNLVRELLRLLSKDDEQIIGLRLPASAHLARRAVCTARSSCYAWRREIRITGIVWLQEVVDKIEAKHQVGQDNDPLNVLLW